MYFPFKQNKLITPVSYFPVNKGFKLSCEIKIEHAFSCTGTIFRSMQVLKYQYSLYIFNIYLTILQTSKTQNVALHVGQGDFPLIHISGLC